MNVVVKSALQVAAFSAWWWLVDALVRALGWNAPSSIIALGLFFLLLLLGLRLEWVSGGVRFLLGDMTLFFIPPAVAIALHSELLLEQGLKIMVIVLLGNLLVMWVYGRLVGWLIERQSRGQEPRT